VEQLIDHDTLGIYHIVCQGRCSRYDFAKAILKAAHMEDKLELHPIRAADAGSTPSYTVLDNLMLRLDNLPQPRPWKEALNEYINSLQ
jgi:dTDP-4-dehydrorhamnose reductase